MASAHLHLLLNFLGDAKTTPRTDQPGGSLENVVGGRRWTDGTGSGQVDTTFVDAARVLGSSATQSYDFLAAGTLEDIDGNTVDLDELKMLAIVVSAGDVIINAPAANFLGIFTDATDILNVSTAYFQDFGPAGLDVTTNSKIDVTAGGSGATYTLIAVGAS